MSWFFCSCDWKVRKCDSLWAGCGSRAGVCAPLFYRAVENFCNELWTCGEFLFTLRFWPLTLCSRNHSSKVTTCSKFGGSRFSRVWFTVWKNVYSQKRWTAWATGVGIERCGATDWWCVRTVAGLLWQATWSTTQQTRHGGTQTGSLRLLTVTGCQPRYVAFNQTPLTTSRSPPATELDTDHCRRPWYSTLLTVGHY